MRIRDKGINHQLITVFVCLFNHVLLGIILSGAEREAAGQLLYTGGTKLLRTPPSLSRSRSFMIPPMDAIVRVEKRVVLDSRFQDVV